MNKILDQVNREFAKLNKRIEELESNAQKSRTARPTKKAEEST